ncbi:MAG: hypothetical protein B6I20_04735 [Bacteroidetes bacterium 4572_117]|nr:MAG: hypothetical protein B6I20_04735 [Bacteroidetes bacterium 4572_117]
MSIIICKFCKSENDAENERCFSCNAPLPKTSVLSEKAKEHLSNYINSIEKRLKAEMKKADMPLFISFMLITLIWIFVSFISYKSFPEDTTIIVILAVVLGLGLFIAWGGLIKHFEHKAAEKAFDPKIKTEINAYLKEMNISGPSFKMLASEILSAKSSLLKFLDDLQ